MSAHAATFTSFDAFQTAIGFAPSVTEDFSGVADGTTLTSTTFATTGTTVVVSEPTAESFVDGEALRLSVDNPSGPEQVPFTTSITFILPQATTFFGIDFGLGSFGGIGTGVGNDSGTIVTAGSETFDFNDLTPGGDDIEYSGFFGLTSTTAFDRIVLTSAGANTFNRDDDFVVDTLVFADLAPAPIPLPAGLPLLAGGFVLLGALRMRKLSVK
ncbi:MAG: VPLPA-CTERM sorting domain-containing protein [Pseudomonadota bacterium]